MTKQLPSHKMSSGIKLPYIQLLDCSKMMVASEPCQAGCYRGKVLIQPFDKVCQI